MKALRTPLLLFALPATIAGSAPAVFLYDRMAILHGEWWRLWTGHWVHFSTSHLAWDLAVLLAAGTWLERVRPGLLVRYTLAGAPLLSLGLLAFDPAMQFYGGLSGLATGVVALLAMVQLATRPAERAWWLGVVALVAAKTAADAVSPSPLFSEFATAGVRVSPLAHLLGAISALPFFLAFRGHREAPATAAQ